MTTSWHDAPLGAQRPRLCTLPNAVTTDSGDQAIDLARYAGLVLDDWQQFVLRGALGERADGRWAAGEVGLIVPRQNGKGAILEARELAGLFLFNERLILHSAHEFKTAKEAFMRIRGLIEQTPDLLKRVKQFRYSNEDVSVELVNGARLRFVARSTGSARGFSADAIILDESYNLPLEALAAMLPTMAARPNPQLWYTSSAGMESSEALAMVRERGRLGSPGMAYFEWSAAEDADLDDPVAWAQANPGLGIRIDPEFVAQMRGALDEKGFAREHLGIWHDPGTQSVIDPDVWAALADGNSAPVGATAFAVDVAPDRGTASIAVAGRRDDDLLHVEIAAHQRRTDWIVPWLVERVEKWHPVAVVIDVAGPAASLIPDLETAGVSVKTTSAREMGQACGAFYDAATQDRLRHRDDPILNAALGAARKRPLGDAWAWHRKDTTGRYR